MPSQASLTELAMRERGFPRPALETALNRLAKAARGGAPFLVVRGEDGIGKSFLLQLLAERLDGDLRVAPIPIGALSPAELGEWALGCLGASAVGDGLAALADVARQGPPVVVLIDGAERLPLETAHAIRSLAGSSEGAVRFVLALGPEAPPEIAEALGPERLDEELTKPLEPTEAILWIQPLLDNGGVDAPPLDDVDATIRGWLAEADGNPGRLLSAVQRWLDATQEALPAAPPPTPPLDLPVAPPVALPDAEPVPAPAPEPARDAAHPGPDLFPTTAGAAGYVPRAATERALEALERSIADEPAVTVLAGPPGIGKSTTARVLCAQLAMRFRVVDVPYPSLEPGELARWAMESIAPGTPELGALEAFHQAGLEQERSGRPILLRIEDAQNLPSATLAWLELSATGPSRIRSLLTWTDDGTAPIPKRPAIRCVPLDERMSEAEAHAHLARRLRLGAEPGSGTDGAVLSDAVLDTIVADADGNPAALHRAADAQLRSLQPRTLPNAAGPGMAPEVASEPTPAEGAAAASLRWPFAAALGCAIAILWLLR